MTRYNLNELSFLIGSFKDVINTFGENSKSVEFYKRQVDGLINIGQVSRDSVELVNRVVGMQNTNSVKWESAKTNIDQYIFGIENTMNADNDASKKAIIAMIFNSGKISEKVKDLINETYGIKSLNINLSGKTGSFGQLKSSSAVEENIGKPENNRKPKGIKERREEAAFILKRFKEGYKGTHNLCIRIRNTNACCSGDPSSFAIDLDKMIRALDGNYAQELTYYAVLKSAPEWRISYLASDSWSSGSSWQDLAKTEELNHIDWKTL